MYTNVVEIAAHSVTCLFGVILLRVVTTEAVAVVMAIMIDHKCKSYLGISDKDLIAGSTGVVMLEM